MPLFDTSIYAVQPKSVQDFEREDSAATLNKLQALAAQYGLEKAKREDARANQLQAIIDNAPKGGSYKDMSAHYRNNGLYDKALELDKAQGELDKTGAVTAKDNAEAAKKQFDLQQAKLEHGIQTMLSASRPEDLKGAIDEAVQLGHFSPEQGQMFLSKVPADPNQFPQFRERYIRMLLDQKEQLLKQTQANTGGKTVQGSFDPVTGKNTINNEIQNTQSPDNYANNKRIEEEGKKNRAQSEDHFNKSLKVQQQRLEQAGQAPFKAASEDERKAAGWLSQANNAWENMKSVAFDKQGNITDAASPGLIETLTPNGMKNLVRDDKRQQFMQGSSSLAEALLRAATGAGVNKDEAKQKIEELTPVFGDSPKVIKQKMDSIPVYLKSLEVRAGRAAPQSPSVPNKTSGGASVSNW